MLLSSLASLSPALSSLACISLSHLPSPLSRCSLTRCHSLTSPLLSRVHLSLTCPLSPLSHAHAPPLPSLASLSRACSFAVLSSLPSLSHQVSFYLTALSRLSLTRVLLHCPLLPLSYAHAPSLPSPLHAALPPPPRGHLGCRLSRRRRAPPLKTPLILSLLLTCTSDADPLADTCLPHRCRSSLRACNNRRPIIYP